MKGLNFIVSPGGEVFDVGYGRHRQEIAQRCGYELYHDAWIDYLTGNREAPPQGASRMLCESEFAERQVGWIVVSTFPAKDSKILVTKQLPTQAALIAYEDRMISMLDSPRADEIRSLIE